MSLVLGEFHQNDTMEGFTVSIQGEDMVGATARMEFKDSANGGKVSLSPTITISGDTVTMPRTQLVDMVPGRHYFDVVVYFANGRIVTVAEGRVTVKHRVTSREVTP